MRNRLLPAVVVMIALFGPGGSSLPAGGLSVEGHWPYGDEQSVLLGDGLAVVRSGAALLVLDISDPTAPQVVGEAVFEWGVEPLAISADAYLYAVTRNELNVSHVHILDLSMPSQPIEIATVAVPGSVHDLALVGDRLYVAAGDAGLRIVDISDPSAPVVLGSLAFGVEVTSVEVSGRRAYVTTEGAKPTLHVVDCADPSAPTVLGFASAPERLWAVATTSELLVAYYFDGIWFGSYGVYIFDVGDPAEPVLTGMIGLGRSAPRGISVVGSLLAVGHKSKLDFYNIDTPSSPTGIGRLAVPGEVGGVALDAANVYFTSTTDGVGVAEVSLSAGPVVVAWVDGPPAGPSTAVAVSDKLAYLGEVDSTVRVFDVSDPKRPVPLGAIKTSLSEISDVAVAGDLVLVTGEGETTPGALVVLDASDPDSLLQLSSLGFTKTTGSVAVSDTIAIVGEGHSGIVFVDVADPKAPVEVGRFSTGGSPTGLAARGNLVFVTDYNPPDGGLRILDISEPMAPVEIGFAPSPHGDPRGFALSGSYALVAARYDGLRVVDISDPTAPVEVGDVATTSDTARVVAAGTWAYVLDRGYPRYRLRLFDITNPLAPLEVAFAEPGALPQSLAAIGEDVLVTTLSAELTILSLRVAVFADGFESGDTSAWSSTTSAWSSTTD